jgi:cytochrome c biogenesis protein CcmG, thiol:disulfide interchange protein DsbE
MKSGRGESNPHFWLGKPASWPLDNAREVRAVYRAGTTLQRVRPSVYWPLSIAATALVALLSYGVVSSGPDTTIDDSIAAGERIDAPVAELRELGGDGTGSLADYKGQVVVLNVWASWCPPCRSEMPLLQRTHERIQDQDALVLGIDSQDASEDAMSFLRDHDIDFPSLRDGDGEYANELGVTALPETFLIDRQGRIAALVRGEIDQAWLDEHLTPLLEEKIS